MQIRPTITSADEFASFCETLHGERFVTLDTEFIRERTYFPQLCLLQIGTSKEAVAVDPLAEGMDLTPLYRVLADPSIIKVFHAAGQDVEIFFRLSGIIPTPLYDTQIAGMVCGFGESAISRTSSPPSAISAWVSQQRLSAVPRHDAFLMYLKRSETPSATIMSFLDDGSPTSVRGNSGEPIIQIPSPGFGA